MHQTSKHCRLIRLCPIICKVFSSILLQKAIRTLDFHKPREQDKFRARYFTTDYLHAVNQLQEKFNEYNILVCFTFVEFEKSFDSKEHEPLFAGSKNQGVDEVYLNVLKILYSEATSILPELVHHVCNTLPAAR